MELDIVELEGGRVTQVRLAGRLDAAAAERIGARMTAAVVAQDRPAVVDLGGVDFIASMGLRLLISCAKGAASKGHRMVAYGARGMVADVLDQSAIEQLVPHVASEAEALARATG